MYLSEKRSEETAVYLQHKSVNKIQLKLKWGIEEQHRLTIQLIFSVIGYEINRENVLK